MSQVNHNWSYITEVDGNTIWERLRIIRNFLTERRKALALAELNQKNIEAKLARFDKRIQSKQNFLNECGADASFAGSDQEVDLEEELYKLQYERQQLLIETSDLPDLTQDCRDEILFLETFEKRLMEEAEKERVPGKSDREMYEINFPKESRTRLFKKATAELVAHGRLTPDTIHYLRKDTKVLEMLGKVEIMQVGLNEAGMPVEQKIALLPRNLLTVISQTNGIQDVDDGNFMGLMQKDVPELLGQNN